MGDLSDIKRLIEVVRVMRLNSLLVVKDDLVDNFGDKCKFFAMLGFW